MASSHPGRITDAIKSNVEKANFISRLIFNFAYRYKVRWINYGFSTPILDRLLFKKLKSLLGGKTRTMLVGGSPLNASTQQIIETCLCMKLSQGYGLTEATASTSIQKWTDLSYERVGGPMSVVTLKLVNYNEGNYTVKDKPFPRGEIVLSGDIICEGYFKLPDETEKAFYNSDGKRWFRTGDIGEVHKDGSIKIIDRKKDLVKLQMGEYIALGKIENILQSHPIIVNMICVCADSTQNFCVAVVEPNKEKLMEFAEKIGIKQKNFQDVIINPDFISIFTTDLAKFAKEAKLEKYEIPKVVTLVKETWDIESGLITTSFKLKRREIENRYRKEIKEMYGLH